MITHCPYCGCGVFKASEQPNTVFNGKEFVYCICTQCQIEYVHPLPTEADLKAMYPPSYQQGVITRVTKDEGESSFGLRFPYKLHLSQMGSAPQGEMLDLGCGNGAFIAYAKTCNLKVDGVEFGAEQVHALQAAFPDHSFFTVDDFLRSEKKYALIRMSNVLEHLTDPKDFMQQVCSKLLPNGILLAEGPLERNKSFARWIRSMYFKLRSSRKSDHAPTHITLVTAAAQKKFFQDLNLKTESFQITEKPWPYPEKWGAVNGLGSFFKYVLARFSMFVSALMPGWGNCFFYVGRKTEE